MSREAWKGSIPRKHPRNERVISEEELGTKSKINPAFSASQLSTTNFSLYNTYKIWHLVMRKWELIKQSQLLKIKSYILSTLFNEKYGLRLGEFKNTTGTERVKMDYPQNKSYVGKSLSYPSSSLGGTGSLTKSLDRKSVV